MDLGVFCAALSGWLDVESTTFGNRGLRRNRRIRLAPLP